MIDAAAGIGVLLEVADLHIVARETCDATPSSGGGPETTARAGFGMLKVLIATALSVPAISLAASLVHLTF
jgi:hypothetical protein